MSILTPAAILWFARHIESQHRRRQPHPRFRRPSVDPRHLPGLIPQRPPGHLDQGDLAFGVAVDPHGGASGLVEAFPEHPVSTEQAELAGLPSGDPGAHFSAVDSDPACAA